MQRIAVGLLVAALALGGCLGDGGGREGGDEAPLAPAGPALAAHDSAGAAAVPAAAAGLAARVIDAGREGYEPTLGVDSAGAIYATSGGGLVKSADRGATWTA